MHRQPPERRHVERLVKGAGVHHRLAHVAEDHLVAAAILDREADAGGERHVPAHDAVAAEEVQVAVEEVHGAALAVHHAVAAPEQLGHHVARRHAARERLAVVAVGGDDVVVGAKQRERARAHRLLADVEVAEAADLAERVGLGAALLEAALEQHRVQQLAPQLGVAADVGGRRPGGVGRRLLRSPGSTSGAGRSLGALRRSLRAAPWRCARPRARFVGARAGERRAPESVAFFAMIRAVNVQWCAVRDALVPRPGVCCATRPEVAAYAGLAAHHASRIPSLFTLPPPAPVPRRGSWSARAGRIPRGGSRGPCRCDRARGTPRACSSGRARCASRTGGGTGRA